MSLPEGSDGPSPPSYDTIVSVDAILDKIATAGNAVRDLKASKADKAKIKVAVVKLLEAKQQYEDLTGQYPPTDSKPAAPPQATAPAAGGDADAILRQIASASNAVKDLKAGKANKSKIRVAVVKLLEAKQQYKDLTGYDPPVGGNMG